MTLEKRYKTVQNRIQKAVENAVEKAIDSQQNKNKVDLLAVSKKQSIAKIREVYALEQRKFGESYVQEAVQKIQELEDLAIQWHFIGPIQSNKTKAIAQHFSWVQSVDSEKIMRRLNNQRTKDLPKLNVLLQLKVGDEATKRGFNSHELLALCRQSHHYENIRIRGLMSIPAPSTQYNEQLTQFKSCYHVFQQMQEIIAVDTLSIGMSSDLEAAITAGATMVRIGTDIFGKRQ